MPGHRASVLRVLTALVFLLPVILCLAVRPWNQLKLTGRWQQWQSSTHAAQPNAVEWNLHDQLNDTVTSLAVASAYNFSLPEDPLKGAVDLLVDVPEFQCNQTNYWPLTCHETCGASQESVPSIAHLVQIGGRLEFRHWVAVMSAIKFIPAQIVVIYYWGNVTSDTCWSRGLSQHPRVIFKAINETYFPTALNGYQVTERAHQTDFLRLSALWNTGGVYMDFDAILTKPFSDLLDNEGVVSAQNDQDIGNGLLVARRRSCFVCAFAQAACSNFNGTWDAHSILSLTSMVRKRGKEVHAVRVLNYTEGFFPFSWQKQYLVQLFDTDRRNLTFEVSSVYAMHLYASSVQLRMSNLTLSWDWMMNSTSIVAAAMRNALPNHIIANLLEPSKGMPSACGQPLPSACAKTLLENVWRKYADAAGGGLDIAT